MGLSWRKSVGFGAARLNFSNSGVGWSVGSRGARISSGSRGTYVHFGAYGVRYRQRIDRRPAVAPRPPAAGPRPGLVQHVEVVDPLSIVESDADRLLAQIREARGRGWCTTSCVGIAIIFFILTAIVAAENEGWSPSSIVLGVLGASSLATLPWANWRDAAVRRVEIRYVLDPVGQQVCEGLDLLFQNLQGTRAIWSVATRHDHGDWKRNAGAGTSVDRRMISVRHGAPPDVATNVRVGCIDLGTGRGQLYFFPDRMLVYRGEEVSAVPYSSLALGHQLIRFVEDGIVPADAEVVGHTWQFVNKNGTPDLRFNNNRRLPVVLYGGIEIGSHTGFRVSLQTSSAPISVAMPRVFEVVKAAIRQVEAAGRGMGPLPIPASTSDPLAAPLAGVGSMVAGAACSSWAFVARGWVTLLPEWSLPIVWGAALGLPIAAGVAILVGGAGAPPVHLVAVVAAAGTFVSTTLLIDHLRRAAARKRSSVQVHLNERRAAFRSILIRELKHTPITRFDYESLVRDSDVEPSEAEIVADEIYAGYADRVVADGVITDDERRKLESLAGVLRIDRGRARRIEQLAKEGRYERAVAEAADDGVFTPDEISSLDSLRRSLGLGGELSTRPA